MSPSSNDNGALPPAAIVAEAHGQAAILLVESLIHGLIERSVLSVADAVSIIETAADISREMALAGDVVPASVGGSIKILEAMIRSLGHDLPTPAGL